MLATLRDNLARAPDVEVRHASCVSSFVTFGPFVNRYFFAWRKVMASAVAVVSEAETVALEVRFADVIEMTRNLFDGDVEVESDPDPEIAGLTNIFFFVTTAAESASLIERRLEWHRRLETLPGGLDRRLRLSVRSSR